jgi:hypothetical protein
MFMGGTFSVDNRNTPATVMAVPVSPGFFSALGGHVLSGREFQKSDETSAEPVAIVNDIFARRFGDPAAMTGRSLTGGFTQKKIEYKIIGVVHGLRYAGPSADSGDQVFLLSRGPRFATIVATVIGKPEDHLARVRSAIQSVDPEVPVFDVQTMGQRLDKTLARPQFYTTAILFFGGFSLLLAAIGIYAIASYTVAQRKQEIGIRLALGTTAGRLRARLMQQGLVTVCIGAVPGIAGALAVSRYLSALLPVAEPVSFRVCAAALIPLCVVSAAGIWSATRRISRLSLADVLRAE